MKMHALVTVNLSLSNVLYIFTLNKHPGEGGVKEFVK